MSRKAAGGSGRSTPAPTPAAGSPQPQYSQTQWTSSPQSEIPIDPALQSQSAPTPTPQYAHYQAYSAHYQQNAYYQQYPGMVQHPGTPQAQYPPPTQAAAAVTLTKPQQANTSSSGMDTSDLATMNDALGSAGIDLRAEEESLQRSHEYHSSYRTTDDRARKQPPNPSFDTRILGTTMRSIATKHKVKQIPEDSVNYLALALRTRLQELITQMIAATHHRTDTQFDRPASLYPNGTPMWSIIVRSDVAKQLAAIERIEREEETKVRRERKERTEMAEAHAAALAAQSANAESLYDDPDGNAKRKRKKEGPGVTAKNMSEDVRKKMSNAAASQAAGIGGKYAWMTAGASASKPKAAASATSPAATPAPAPTAGSSWARAYVPTKQSTPSSTPEQPLENDTRTAVTLRDAMFVVEKERGHGAGRGAAVAGCTFVLTDIL